jgi:hypothetical protein
VFAAIVAALVAPTTSADVPSFHMHVFDRVELQRHEYPSGDYVWFNSVFKPKGVPSSGTTTIQLMSATAIFRANGTDYTVWLPPAEITFSPSVTQATLTYNGAEYVETVPSSFTDNVFLSGIQVQRRPLPFPPAGGRWDQARDLADQCQPSSGGEPAVAVGSGRLQPVSHFALASALC